MIKYDHFCLENGLNVYVHEDYTSQVAAFNICYNVGSRDENENKTGFAHLFEHLMFGGSKNIENFDTPLQKVGAENNAFTSPDLTNYYITLPAQNLETAFWLESDRMLSLSFDPKVLEVQRKVVIEEYKQRYLNQPYGDLWLKLRPLAYQKHPYKWATIGKEISHIENATMEDVKDFFHTHYVPNKATLVLGGPVKVEEIKNLCQKWFGDILPGKKTERNLAQEETQTEARFLEISAKVPVNAIYKTFQMPGRYEAGYHCIDLMGDILGRGKSAQLYEKLVKDKPLFSTISAYVLGSLDPGLLVISGNLNENIGFEEANRELDNFIEEFKKQQIDAEELEKVKNQAYATLAFGEVELLNRVMSIAFAANAGNAAWCNEDIEQIQAISNEDINIMSQQILDKNKSCTLFYKAEK